MGIFFIGISNFNLRNTKIDIVSFYYSFIIFLISIAKDFNKKMKERKENAQKAMVSNYRTLVYSSSFIWFIG